MLLREQFPYANDDQDFKNALMDLVTEEEKDLISCEIAKLLELNKIKNELFTGSYDFSKKTESIIRINSAIKQLGVDWSKIPSATVRVLLDLNQNETLIPLRLSLILELPPKLPLLNYYLANLIYLYNKELKDYLESHSSSIYSEFFPPFWQTTISPNLSPYTPYAISSAYIKDESKSLANRLAVAHTLRLSLSYHSSYNFISLEEEENELLLRLKEELELRDVPDSWILDSYLPFNPNSLGESYPFFEGLTL